MEIPERIWHLMAKSLNQETTPQEAGELARLLEQDASVRQQFELLTRIWKEKGQGHDDEGNARKLILKIIDRAESESEPLVDVSAKRARRRRRLFVAAFTILPLLGFGLWFFSKDDNTTLIKGKKTPDALVVNKGSRSRFLLPDGTTVWLNAGSRLYYENDFSGATREVRLEGEAFFDVVKQPKRPFIVHASDIDIRVLGTAFNVKSYPEDRNVETTLYRGLVNVLRRDAPERSMIALRPNEKLVLPKDAANTEQELSEKKTSAGNELSAGYTITPIDSTKKESERFETAWVYSRLEFRGDSFEELALKLERWYNVTITFTDDKVRHLKVNGSFDNETVEQAMVALQAGFPIHYKIVDHEIFIGSSQ